MNFKAFIIFLSQYYERLLAVVVMLLLLIFSVTLVLRVSDLQSRIKKEDENRPVKVESITFNTTKLQESLNLLKDPPPWTTHANHRLFIAPYMKVLNPTTGFPERYKSEIGSEARSPEGLPFAWLKKYGLSTKTSVADLDPDGDGFTNREEFLAGTDPTDPNSTPDVALKLRVTQVLQKQFPFIFNGTAEDTGGFKFSLLRIDRRKSYFVKIGGIVPDKDFPGWRIIDYKEKFDETLNLTIKGPDGKPIREKVDVSELILQKEDRNPIVLVKYKPGYMEDLFARLYFILERRSFDVGVGDVFTLQSIPYQVLSIKKLDGNKPEVILERKDSGKQLKLVAPSRDELQKIQPPITSNSSTELSASQGFQP